MHGAGNDYIYVDTSLYKVPNPEETSRQWSLPHTGIGSDGLVLIGVSPVPEADFTMRIFNADGSEALMCGNASRCIGKYLFEKGLTRKKDIRLLTLSGVKHLHLEVDGKKVVSVTVDMGTPQITTQSLLNAENLKTTDDGHMLLEADGKEWRGTFVSMGNPHFVIFVDDINEVDVSLYGSLLEHNAAFPERCNIEFAQLLGDNKIRTRVAYGSVEAASLWHAERVLVPQLLRHHLPVALVASRILSWTAARFMCAGMRQTIAFTSQAPQNLFSRERQRGFE